VRYLRYKPAQNCLAACRADVDGRPVDFIAKAYRPSASDKFRKAVTLSGVPGPLGLGRFVLAGTSVLVSVFPNDGRLKHLGRLTSPDAVAQLAVRLGALPETAARLETLRHNPERRFVGRLIVDQRPVATVRCYTGRDYAGIVAKAGMLTSREPLRLARRLTRRERWHLLAFEWLRGDLLDDAVRQRTASPYVMRVVGAALAQLHAQEAPALPRRTGASEATALGALARQLAFLHPSLAASARDLAEQVGTRLVAEFASAQPLHGDFYAKQVLLDRGTVAFIDLDEASLGDPAIDLARFRADLEERVVAGDLDAREIEPLVESLFEGYVQTSGSLPASLNLHIAAQLLRVAAHPFRRREPLWPDLTAAIVERAETFLDGSTKTLGSDRAGRHERTPSRVSDSRAVSVASEDSLPIRVTDPLGVTSDSLMPFLGQALNPSEMAPRFARALNGLEAGDDLRVLDISVMRYKPGRRCVVAYDLAVRHVDGRVKEFAVVGKVRARGADITTHDLQRTLWIGSFGAFADDDILIPEPLGVVRELHMGVQRRVPGEPLTRLLEGPSGLRLARRAAEAIYKLHRVFAPTKRRHAVEDEFRILHERLTAVAKAHPLWQARIERLLDGCGRLAARVQRGPRCGIHRDFYPDQLLVNGDRLYLTDLDLYAEGPPALDVGNFAAHVDESSLRHFGDLDRLLDRREMFIERYLQLAPATTRDVIDAWTTLSLARHVAISRLFAERRPFTAALLDLCERRVFGASGNGREISLVCRQEKGATP
jgi:aminoglycoside phosphotransferase (APT) family kinase protein